MEENLVVYNTPNNCIFHRYNGPKFVDPLRHALQRGSEALKFINMPLVLDYVDIKFSCTLPHWASMRPYQSTINHGFYKYHRIAEKNGKKTFEEVDVDEWWCWSPQSLLR